jgi:hypothetical protein
VSDIDLTELEHRWLSRGNLKALIEEAAIVANAIHAGVGGLIKGTMMESEFRDALGLREGELVNVRGANTSSGATP